MVIGAGITGLSAAAAARDLGLSVTVIDDARPTGATNAAAGMLAPFSEAILGDAELGSQMLEAFSMWDSWRRGVNVADDLFELVPTYFAPSTFGDRQEILRWSRDAGVPLEPHGELLRGPLEAVTNPRELLRHLQDQLAQSGVVFEHGEVAGVTEKDSSVIVTFNDDATLRGDAAIIATGASSVLASDALAIRPVRGSLVILSGPTREHSHVTRVLRHGRSLYIIRRRSGEVVIGATSVETSVNIAEAGEVQLLLSDAIDACPELREMAFREVRTGLRPTATSNTLDCRVSPQGLFLQLAGHYRHGVLMAPLSYRTAQEFLS